LKRCPAYAVWFAIVALLIDGLLPTAVAAAKPDAAASSVLCSAAAGIPQPAKDAPTLPARHCALCAAFFVGLVPSRPSGLAARRLAGVAHRGAAPSAAGKTGRPQYAAAQPRAPPVAA
jgi:hypothetical protein